MTNLTPVLGDSKRRLVDLLKQCGEQTARQAAESLELAVTTIRQHFGQLEDDGLVTRRSQAVGPGRPTVYFRLTEAGNRLYPSGDQQMLSNLLDFLSQQGYHRAIDDFFRQYWQERRQIFDDRLQEADAQSLPERLTVLGKFLEDHGFMPTIDIEQDNAVEIRECNCPFKAAVESTHLPCRLEAEFFEQVIGQPLSRVEYIPDGSTACIYRFGPQKNTDSPCCK